MSNVLPGSKPVVVPNTKDLVFISQDGNPRNAELGKIGEVLLGDEDLGNSDSIKKNIKNNNEKTQENAASIEDIKKIIGTEDLGNEGSLKKNIVDVTTQLNANTQEIASKIDKSKIINDCNATEDGFVLDARQGKRIMNEIEGLSNNSISYKGYNVENDFNNLTKTGFYHLADCSSVSNSPIAGWGILEVYATNLYIKQIITTVADNNQYTRTRNENTWTEWKNRG